MKADAYMQDVRTLIQSLPCLAMIEGPEWEQAVAAANAFRIADARALNFCSVDVDYVSIVLKGSMKVQARSDDGRIFSMYRVREGEICGLSMAFLHSKERLFADVCTDGPAVILQIPEAHFDVLLIQSPSFRRYLMSSMSGYVMKLLGLIEEVTFSSLQTRILHRLEDIAKANDSRTIYVTHQELAQEFGSIREVVSRLLKDMENHGIIRMGRGTITLVSPSESYSAPTPQRAQKVAHR